MKSAWRFLVIGGFAVLGLSHAGRAYSDGTEGPSRGPVVAAAEVVTGTADVHAGACGEGMIEVEGDYCADLPEQTCLRWVSTPKGRCAEYAPSEPCRGAPIHKRFCMDKFEYPNRAGDDPIVMKNWYEARDTCAAAGKRLCTDAEWTLACEGPERLAYPYGLTRDAAACNIDKFPLNPKNDLLRRPATRDAEAKRLWQGEASGARKDCKSPHGVFDMTGNVDEWVVNESGKPHRSALKGGYWSWVRGRCRATTDGHAEDFRYYQIGFRCCGDGRQGQQQVQAQPGKTAQTAPTPRAPAP